MKRFAAGLRRVLLSIAMIIGLVLCVSRANIKTASGALLTLLFVGAGGLYLVVSVISLIVRVICRAHMDERNQMIDSFTGVLTYSKNGNVLHFFRRLSFWGLIMLVFNVTALDIPSSMIIGGPYSTDAFLLGYHGFLHWSLVALVISLVLSIIFWAVYLPHYGDGTYNIFQYTSRLIAGDITAPFRIIKTFFGSDKRKDIIGLITMSTFIIVNVVGVLKSV
ncbi:MAG: hypothetical protein ACOYI8_09650 [Christensenellales bacterium]|jgi:hypothetical protein